METGVPGQLRALAAVIVEVEHKLEHVCETTLHHLFPIDVDQ